MLLTSPSHKPFSQACCACRALFALRNRGGPAAVEALDASLAGGSALLKHEVAYVLGQMQDPAAIRALECAPEPQTRRCEARVAPRAVVDLPGGMTERGVMHKAYISGIPAVTH